MSAPLLKAQDPDAEGIQAIATAGAATLMRVACPAGSGPGSAFMVAHPTTGEHFQVTVPDGVAEGQHFEVQVARPAIMATAAPPVMIQQPVVVQQPGPVIITSGPQQVGGDRTKVQPGLTALRQPGVITLSSWEVKEPSLCDTIHLALRCSVADTSRSYIYIRDDHALELNNTMGLLNCCTCFCCCETPDNVRVEHFDRPPWAKECNTAPFPYCCCIYQSQPKLEVVDLGCMFCGVKIDPCCCGKAVVIMPFEMMPPPCCCCSNRVSGCDNCCGLCGPVTGNPKIYGLFSPQPKNADAFVQAAKMAMASVGGAPILSEEMER